MMSHALQLSPTERAAQSRKAVDIDVGVWIRKTEFVIVVPTNDMVPFDYSVALFATSVTAQKVHRLKAAHSRSRMLTRTPDALSFVRLLGMAISRPIGVSPCPGNVNSASSLVLRSPPTAMLVLGRPELGQGDLWVPVT
jgi:hypothetical protein